MGYSPIHLMMLLALGTALCMVVDEQTQAEEPPGYGSKSFQVRPLRENRFGITLPPREYGPKGEAVWLNSRGGVSIARRNMGSYEFPKLKDGEVVPMFGYLYRISNRSSLDRIGSDDKLQKFSARPDAYIIPLRRGGIGKCQITYGSSNFEDFYLESITSQDLENQDKPVANIRIHNLRSDPQKFRRGDSLRLGKSNYLVRNIVPRDARTKLIGWVEIEREHKPKTRKK